VSGHSKWSTIKRQKGAKAAARGALFTKIGNAIAVAAKGGSDPETNFSLRLAVDKAKASNMPLANIQRSIDRGSGKLGGTLIHEVTYEGYGPSGVAIIVEAATDNINRTLPDVRLALSKHGGRIAEQGAVAFQFERKGMIRIKGKGDELMLEMMDLGVDDAKEEDDEMILYTDQKELAIIRDKIKELKVEIIDAELAYVPRTIIEITDKIVAGKIIRLMDALEDIDDVTNIYTNFDIPEDLID
jgi:YebC/PmpR family DNA-binding regulatory protein